MRVRFLQDTVFETEGFRKGPFFEAGSVHDLREDLAQKWINRGVAEKVEPALPRATRTPAPPPAPPAPPPEPPAPPASPPEPPVQV